MQILRMIICFLLFERALLLCPQFSSCVHRIDETPQESSDRNHPSAWKFSLQNILERLMKSFLQLSKNEIERKRKAQVNS